MSFLDHYLTKHRLDEMPGKIKDNLSKLESNLKKYTEKSKGDLTFEDAIKEYGPQISDLVERVSNYIENRPPITLGNVWGIFRFVQSIAIEVYQIVEAMKDAIVDDSMSPEEQHRIKVEFGTEFVYFVWMTVDPLKDKFTWIPFKKSIEKKIVKWLAGMALESTVDFFAAQGMSAFSSKGWILDAPKGKKGKRKGKKTIRMKAIPD